MSAQLNTKNVIGMSIAFVCGVLFWYLWSSISSREADQVPPSAAYVRALINDCGAFTSVEGNARRAVIVTRVGQQLDSGGMTFADIEWQWVAGSRSSDGKTHNMEIILIYSLRYERWIVYSFPSSSGGIVASYPCDEKE